MTPGLIIRKNVLFLMGGLLIIVGSLFFILQYDQATIHLWSDARHSIWGDQWMPFLTHLGDGLAFILLALIAVLFFDRRALATVLISAVLTLLITAGLKAAFNEDRPLKYFEKQGIELNQVEGVKPRYKHSFPSGHTTTAFAIWGILAFWLRKKPWQLLCVLIAATAAYSRIYLNMHFLRDVSTGAALGCFIMILSLFLTFKLKSTWFTKTWFKWGNEVL